MGALAPVVQTASCVGSLAIQSEVLGRAHLPSLCTCCTHAGSGSCGVVRVHKTCSVRCIAPLPAPQPTGPPWCPLPSRSYGLVRVRENAESIAFYGGEDNEARLLNSRLQGAVDNFLGRFDVCWAGWDSLVLFDLFDREQGRLSCFIAAAPLPWPCSAPASASSWPPV